MKRKICILLIIFLAFFNWRASTSYPETQFTFGPPIKDITLLRGGMKVFSLELSNFTPDKKLRFKIYAQDLRMKRGGGIEFLPKGNAHRSCAEWVKIKPKEIEVKPNSVEKIIVELSAPASTAPGGYYAAIISELTEEERPKTSGVKIKWRLASLIKLTITGGRLEKRAEIEDLRLALPEEAEEKELAFVASLKNEGNIHIKAEGKLVIMNLDRRRKGQVDFDMGTGTILPGDTRDFLAVYDRLLSEGEYIAKATFRCGSPSALKKELPFSIAVGSKPTDEKEDLIILPSLKLIPEEIDLMIPAGGFRTAGFTIHNQRRDSLRIQMTLDEGAGNQDWFKIEPQEIIVEGGRGKKILLRINVPEDVKEGEHKTEIKLSPFLITDEAEESLEPVNIGINLEIPKF